MPNDAYWKPKLAGGQDERLFTLANDRSQGLYQIDRQTVAPLKYLGGAQVVGFEVVMGIDATELSDWKITVSARDRLGGGTARFRSGDLDLLFQPNRRGFEGTLTVDALMQKSKASVNQNLFELTVDFTARRASGSPIEGTENAKEPLHLLLQKVVILLPEMMGSSLWIEGSKAWPSAQIERLERLRCSDRGQPINSADKITFNWPSERQDPDDCERWLNSDLPKLKYKQGRKSDVVPYYRLQGYPYDWRLPLSEVVNRLFGAEDALDAKQQTEMLHADPEFEGQGRQEAAPPTIRTVLSHLLPESPFLTEKVALVGHGVGGLIVHAAMQRAEAADVIDRAFFVSTPFFGALTAYDAFLTGMWRLGEEDGFSLQQDSFEAIAPNLPLLYHFTPSHQFPYPAAKITQTDGTQQTIDRQTEDANAVIQSVQDLATAQGIDALIATTARWNRTLAEAADQFYRDRQQPSIGLSENQSLAFYGIAGPKSTIGQVLVDGRLDKAAGGNTSALSQPFQTEGDGIVPVESLQGAFPLEALYPIEGASHLSLIVNKTVWSAVSERLVDWVPVASLPPRPQPWVEESPAAITTFSLVDEAGKPLANEAYRAEFPDGSVQEGQLDQQGKGRLTVAGIAAGACIVSFPNIDENDWLVGR